MKKTVILSLTFLTWVIAFAQTPEPPTTSGEAAAVLSSAREALGGEKRISSVKTIVASGATRQLQGDNLVPILFEISIELPDKYVRTDEIPARESGPSSRGFNGDGLIQVGDAPGPGARRGGPPPSAPPPAPQALLRGVNPQRARPRACPPELREVQAERRRAHRRAQPLPSNRISRASRWACSRRLSVRIRSRLAMRARLKRRREKPTSSM